MGRNRQNPQNHNIPNTSNGTKRSDKKTMKTKRQLEEELGDLEAQIRDMEVRANEIRRELMRS